jgi:hypothetical protein
VTSLDGTMATGNTRTSVFRVAAILHPYPVATRSGWAIEHVESDEQDSAVAAHGLGG